MYTPIIGITPQYDPERNRVFIVSDYLDAIHYAGGIPIVLPLINTDSKLRELCSRCDGFLYTGGPDISPFYFGEETIKDYGVVLPQRDQMEETLFHIAMESEKPILGICRGIQVLNVFLGGTLYQDIDSQFVPEVFSTSSENKQRYSYPLSLDGKLSPLEHYQKSGDTVLSHSIYIDEDSLLYNITGKAYMQVNSFHHQAIKELAPSLKIAAFSPDSLIEAIYMPNHKYFLGVQWHPEHLYSVDENASALFKSFVDACRI